MVLAQLLDFRDTSTKNAKLLSLVLEPFLYTAKMSYYAWKGEELF